MALALRSRIPHLKASRVPGWVYRTTMAKYLQFALVTLLVYDSVTILKKEVRYFWKSPLNSTTIVYFANRYTGILAAVAQLFWYSYDANLALPYIVGNFSEWTREICNWCTIVLIDYILMIRVTALYSEDRRVVIFLKLFLVLEASFKLVLLIYTTLLMKVTIVSLAKGMIACASAGRVPVIWGVIDWLIPMIYAVILMVLALYKAVEYWKLSRKFEGSSLMKVLIRDQFLYFSLVISCCIFKMLQYDIIINDNPTLAYIVEALGSPAFLCLLGSRLLINLKEAGELGMNAGTSYKDTMSEMEFVDPME